MDGRFITHPVVYGIELFTKMSVWSKGGICGMALDCKRWIFVFSSQGECCVPDVSTVTSTLNNKAAQSGNWSFEDAVNPTHQTANTMRATSGSVVQLDPSLALNLNVIPIMFTFFPLFRNYTGSLDMKNVNAAPRGPTCGCSFNETITFPLWKIWLCLKLHPRTEEKGCSSDVPFGCRDWIQIYIYIRKEAGGAEGA